jgi:hypothetical protein
MVNGVVGGAVVEVDRRESESKGCDVFYPFGLAPPGVDTYVLWCVDRGRHSVKLFIGFQIGVAELMEVSQPIVSNVVKFVTGKIIIRHHFGYIFLAPRVERQAITCQVTSICFRQEDFFINTKTSNC